MADPRPARRDPLSLGAGVVFFLIGFVVLVGGGHALARSAGWLAPLVLIGLGVLGISSTAGWRRRR